MQSGSKKEENLVRDVSRAAGSVSATRAEWQYGEQSNYNCHQPVIDIQYPAQLSMPEHAVYTFNQMAIT